MGECMFEPVCLSAMLAAGQWVINLQYLQQYWLKVLHTTVLYTAGQPTLLGSS